VCFVNGFAKERVSEISFVSERVSKINSVSERVSNISFVSGREFTRAVKATKRLGALAPDGF
jgi:hypothetical protein